MSRRSTLIAVALLASAVLAPPSRAAENFKIDPAHAFAVFIVNHLGYSNVIGRFNEIEGTFTFDESDLAANKVSVTIKTASVDSNDKARDNHLRSADFFNAREFPTMTFVSTRVEKTGERTGRLHGNLTLIGVTRPIVLDVTFNKMAPHPLPPYKQILTAGFSARGSVKRSEFGMRYALGGVGDDIALLIEVEGAKM